MKNIKWQTLLVLLLISLSAIFYYTHYLLFNDPHHIFIYLVGDIAFVPIEVLLVTLIIHKVLEKREKISLLKKLNMVIGVFFCEVGTTLLKLISEFDPDLEEHKKNLLITANWTSKQIKASSKTTRKQNFKIITQKGNLDNLQEFLNNKRSILLSLLENPNLLEHESFSELLWAVFHLTEELAYRKQLTNLHQKDSEHLAGDIKRAYSILISEWLLYMKHLKEDYPYLFSLAIRTNPFDSEASVELK